MATAIVSHNGSLPERLQKGLAGLYYPAIPEAWSEALQRREWIENLIEETEHALHSV